MSLKLAYGVVSLLSAVTCLLATTIRVPAEYSTIQLAINASSDGDTVLVDIGVYAESVVTPTRHIVLKGNVEPDTGFYPRPVIDPSTLSNPQSRTCLTMAGHFGVVVEDFVFRNGPEMYPRTSGVGGVQHLDSTGVFRRCVWDSTRTGVRADATLRLEHCVFLDNIWTCIEARNRAVTALNTSFHGRTGGWAVVEFGSGSVFRNCSFASVGQGRNILGRGDLMTISNCEFGYFEYSEVPILEIRGRSNLIDSCSFHDCEVTSSIVYVSSPCDYPSVIQNCDFADNYKRMMWSPPNRPQLVAVSEDDAEGCFGVEIRNNVFRDAQRERGARAISVTNQVLIYGNRITRTSGNDYPTIYCVWNGAVLRDNLIYDNRRGVGVQDPAWCDARFNWWGDSTGPYNSNSNPLGQGDEAGDNVEYFPWHTDTLFMTYVHEPRPPLPEKATLLAYPNPFNSVATIQLTLPRSGIARIELFDITGRKVKDLWSGAVGETRDIQFNASDFASGIYFVRAWDPLGNRPYAATKVVLLK